MQDEKGREWDRTLLLLAQLCAEVHGTLTADELKQRPSLRTVLREAEDHSVERFGVRQFDEVLVELAAGTGEFLTPSEIEALRENGRKISEHARAAFAHLRPTQSETYSCSREKAHSIAMAYVGTKGSLWEVKEISEIARPPVVYGVDLTDCWIAYVDRRTPGIIRASEIVAISKT